MSKETNDNDPVERDVMTDIVIRLRTQGCKELVKAQAADEIEKLRFCLRDALEIGYGAVCNWPSICQVALNIKTEDV